MSEANITGFSLEELSATAALGSLGPDLKRLLTIALHTRNLPALIHQIYPTLDDELQRKIVEDLIGMPAVRRLVNLYALGVPELPVATPDKDPVAPSAEMPVDDGVVCDAATVNER